MKTMTNEKKVRKRLFTTKQMVTVSLLSALAYVLMLLHLPFKYLGFLELEFSDIPAVVGGLAFGPVAGVIIELVKNLIKATTASSTLGVGELANFLISIAYIIPVSIIYRKFKGNKKHIFAFGAGMLGMVIAGIVINYFITVPLYAELFGEEAAVIGAAAATIPMIKSLGMVVIIGITPFNIVKSLAMSIIGYYTYKIFIKTVPME